MSAGLPESLNVSEVFTKYQAQLRGFISKRVVSNEENDFLTEVTEVLLADNASPETSYLRSMVWTELDTALEELPPLQREIFELTELQGFSFKEISESTGIPINTLLSRKRYAVLYLRDKLKNLYEDLLGE